jgi:hypothetical protein
MLFAYKTEYPAIFRSSYWGCFNASTNTFDSIVFENRNLFVEQYGIIKYNTRCPAYVSTEYQERYGKFFDHVECYETSQGEYVLLSSPYAKTPETVRVYEELNWVKYLPLYTCEASTYLKVIQKRRHSKKQ